MNTSRARIHFLCLVDLIFEGTEENLCSAFDGEKFFLRSIARRSSRAVVLKLQGNIWGAWILNTSGENAILESFSFP